MLLLLFLLLISQAWGWYYPSHLNRMEVVLNYSPMEDVEVRLELPIGSDYNYSDVRFTYINGTEEVEVAYWHEGGNAFWVRVPQLPARLYLYFNGSGDSLSNGSATFHFFDDFEGIGSHWVMDRGLSPITVSSTEVGINQLAGMAADIGFNMWDVAPGEGYIAEARVKIRGSGGSYSGVFASPMSSPYTVSSNGGSDATLLYMTLGNLQVSHYFGSGCRRGYDIHLSSLPLYLSQDVYYTTAIEVVRTPSLWNVVLKLNGREIHRDSTATWCKPLRWLRVGFFTDGGAGSDPKVTVYDWVRVRKYYDEGAMAITYGPIEDAATLEIEMEPTNGSFVGSPFTVTIWVNASNATNVSLLVDNALVGQWTVEGETLLRKALSLSAGSHTLEAVAEMGARRVSERAEIVVFPPQGGGGDSVCYRCIAKRVWSYKERNVNLTPVLEVLEGLEGKVDGIGDRVKSLGEELEKVKGELEGLERGEELEELAEKMERVERKLEELEKAIGELERGHRAMAQPQPVDVEHVTVVREEKDRLTPLLVGVAVVEGIAVSGLAYLLLQRGFRRGWR